MAANKAIVNVSASVLLDSLKKGVTGTAVYNLNDGAGDDDCWLYYLAGLTTGSGAVLNGTPSFLVPGGDSTDNVAATDNVYFVVLHHTGLKADGVTKTATDTEVYFNPFNTTAAAGASNMILKPGEVWWARLHTQEIQHILAKCSADTVNLAMYAIVDDE